MKWKVVALALVTASLGIVGSTVAGSWSPRSKPRHAALVHVAAAPHPVPRKQVFRPPRLVRAARPPTQLPRTGFGLESVAELAVVLLAAGLLLRQLAV